MAESGDPITSMQLITHDMITIYIKAVQQTSKPPVSLGKYIHPYLYSLKLVNV